jgi:hypothetical protein
MASAKWNRAVMKMVCPADDSKNMRRRIPQLLPPRKIGQALMYTTKTGQRCLHGARCRDIKPKKW